MGEREVSMRRFVISASVFVCLGLGTSVAFAQDEGDVKTKFYDFDDMLIDGEFKKPEGLVYGTVEKAKFARLLSLKKSFLPKIQESAMTTP